MANLRPPSPVVIRWPSTATIASPSRILPSAGEPGSTARTMGSELKFHTLSASVTEIWQFVHSKLVIPMAPRGGRPSGHVPLATPVWRID